MVMDPVNAPTSSKIEIPEGKPVKIELNSNFAVEFEFKKYSEESQAFLEYDKYPKDYLNKSVINARTIEMHPNEELLSVYTADTIVNLPGLTYHFLFKRDGEDHISYFEYIDNSGSQFALKGTIPIKNTELLFPISVVRELLIPEQGFNTFDIQNYFAEIGRNLLLCPRGECYDCGRRYSSLGWIDAIVPDDVWDKIRPAPAVESGGLLCISCIAKRCRQIGLTRVPVKVTSGVLDITTDIWTDD